MAAFLTKWLDLVLGKCPARGTSGGPSAPGKRLAIHGTAQREEIHLYPDGEGHLLVGAGCWCQPRVKVACPRCRDGSCQRCDGGLTYATGRPEDGRTFYIEHRSPGRC